MEQGTLRYRIGVLATGHTANVIMVVAFDGVLYPIVINLLGAFWGWLVMTPLSFLVCWLTLVFYDWARVDWLGLEMIKRAQGRLSKLGRHLRFTLMALVTDPFMTTAYMREGSYNGLSFRDWRVFVGSLVIGNVFWTAVTATSLSVFQDNIYWVMFVMTGLTLSVPLLRQAITRAVS